MRVELVVLIDGIYLGPAEGVVPECLIQRILLYFQVEADCILEHVDLAYFYRLNAREDALELLSVHLHHVVVLLAEALVLLPQWFCGLLEAVHL